ncbi:glycosyltransferase [Gluconacetobacter tumulisoli]|nr:glycosyltransferase [Gluconacetobacter tumulisoli]
MDLHCVAGKVLVATPRLAAEHDPRKLDILQRQQLDRLLIALAGPVAIAWFYTPMALEFAAHVPAAITVYDCMDELSMFRGASPRLSLLERRLLKKADLVFAGGRSLFEAKRRICGNVHLFPSSVDVTHFHQARDSQSAQPPDQANLPRPRIGFFGVIDERIDYVLLSAMATARPDWHFIMVGPTAKIDPAHLPQHPNLHWIGKRSYDELPAYLAGWDAGIMPFALNDATRFISPTKTPEFLAAAVPLVSTPIADVITDWGNDNLVEIADGPEAMIAALERLLKRPRAQWLANVDERLSKQSWDMIWAGMERLIDRTAIGKSLTDRPRPLDVKRYE